MAVVIGGVQRCPLNVPLKRPFSIATTTLNVVESAACRIRLDSNGKGIDSKNSRCTFGYGEVPVLHPVTAETQSSALDALQKAHHVFSGIPIMGSKHESEMMTLLSDSFEKYDTQSDCLGEWIFGLDTFDDSRRFLLANAETSAEIARLILDGIREGDFYRLLYNEFPDHEYAAVRNGLECAVIDAMATRYGIPLVSLFAGYRHSRSFPKNSAAFRSKKNWKNPEEGGIFEDRRISTDITIPICEGAEAIQLARQYKNMGFDTIKVKVGGEIDDKNNMNEGRNASTSCTNTQLISDIERLIAIREGFRECKLVIDCNEGTIMDTFPR